MIIRWNARSARERWLVGAMLVLAAILLAWLIVVRPLADALDAARMREGDAALALAQARARAEPARLAVAAATGPVAAIVARTAGQAGFAAPRVGDAGPGRATVALDAARPQALFGWIAQMEQNGLVVERLRVQANADHTLAAALTLRGRR